VGIGEAAESQKAGVAPACLTGAWSRATRRERQVGRGAGYGRRYFEADSCELGQAGSARASTWGDILGTAASRNGSAVPPGCLADAKRFP
jgi:hypothetical protein